MIYAIWMIRSKVGSKGLQVLGSRWVRNPITNEVRTFTDLAEAKAAASDMLKMGCLNFAAQVYNPNRKES